MQSQQTYVPLVQASMILTRINPRSQPFLCCICTRLSARLWCGVGWCWGPRHCGCRNRGGCAATCNLGCLCSRPLPGPICPRADSKLLCGVNGAGALLPRNNCCLLLPRGSPPETFVSVAPPSVHANKVPYGQTHPHYQCADNHLQSSAWTTPKALWAVSAQLDQVLSQGPSI